MNGNITSKLLRGLCTVILALSGIALPLSPQDLPDNGAIRVESALVTVPVIVRDVKGRFVSGLGVDSFRLFEDGVRVPISVFLTSEDPIKIALLLDTSVSATTVLGKIKKAARRFLRQLRERDLATVATFSTEVETICPFSSDPKELEDAIKNAKVGGGMTKMRDAVHQAISKRLRSGGGRKAIVLLTDGQDHGSRISEPELLDEVAASGTLIYSIFYEVDPRELFEKLSGVSSRIPDRTAERENGPYAEWNEREREAAEYLGKISELSGGRFYRSEVAKLDDAFKQISEDLRSQYLLGFYPQAAKFDGSTHTLVVNVAVPEASVRSRRSYRAAAKSVP